MAKSSKGGATGSKSGKRPHQHQIVESASGRRYQKVGGKWKEIPTGHVCGCQAKKRKRKS